MPSGDLDRAAWLWPGRKRNAMMGIRRITAGAVALVVVGSLGVSTLALGQIDTVGATTVKTSASASRPMVLRWAARAILPA